MWCGVREVSTMVCGVVRRSLFYVVNGTSMQPSRLNRASAHYLIIRLVCFDQELMNVQLNDK